MVQSPKRYEYRGLPSNWEKPLGLRSLEQTLRTTFQCRPVYLQAALGTSERRGKKKGRGYWAQALPIPYVCFEGKPGARISTHSRPIVSQISRCRVNQMSDFLPHELGVNFVDDVPLPKVLRTKSVERQ